MTYDQARTAEELSLLQPSLLQFVQQYQKDRPTVILLPGGMASSLLQADQAYNGGDGPFACQTVWLPVEIFCGGAPQLAMTGDIDWQEHITDALGTIAFAGMNPYSGFQLWCTLNELNCFILGWDWRRRLEHTVDFMEQSFLPALQTMIQQQYGVDPLQNYTLIGHSYGGMVLKLFLTRGGNFVPGISRAITVGSPFYGYGGSQHYYFAGLTELNTFYSRKEVATIIGSMQGPYSLLFLDFPTYEDVAAALQDDPYPLNAYPSLDSTNPATIADPYNPATNGALVRYPEGGWFDTGSLAQGLATRANLVAPLPTDVNAKFYNIRGVQTNSAGAVIDGTISRQTWDWINPGFDPNSDPDPIHSFNGPGDDTLPAWSTRLVTTPKENVITIQGSVDDLFEHMFLMDHPLVLAALQQLLGLDIAALGLFKQISVKRVPAASSEALRDFLHEVAAARRLGGRAAAIKLLAETNQRDLQSLTRRFFNNLLKPPVYER